jgi:hypothetical protein
MNKGKRHENVTYRVDGLAGGGGDELHPDLLERGGGAGPVSSQPSPPNSQQLKLGCHTIRIKLRPCYSNQFCEIPLNAIFASPYKTKNS